MSRIGRWVQLNLGLRSKFLIFVSLVLVIVFSLFAYLFIQDRTTNLRNSLYDEAKAFAVLSTEPLGNTFAIYKDSGNAPIEKQMKEFIALNESVVNIAIVDISGAVLYNHNKDMSVSATAEHAKSFEPVYRVNERGVIESIVYPYFEASGAHRYSVVYYISDQQIQEIINNDSLSSVAFTAFALLVTGSALYVLINVLILRPLVSVSEQAETISAGNLDQQIEVSSKDEIGTLGVSVNRMAESLKKHIAQLREVDKVKSEFMMITSHNLRTPLTIINGYLENADRYANDPSKLIDIFGRIRTSVDRLEMFAEDVLTISQFELGAQNNNSELIDMQVFTQKISDEFRPGAETKGITFDSSISLDNKRVQASAPHIRSALWNLLDNALKFTNEGGNISLTGSQQDDKVLITVKDSGIGISKDEIPKLFTKFHRGTSTLTYDYGGTGIGLYASKVMVENYGGTITVTSKEGEGSSFTISLPAHPEQSAV